MLQIRNKISDKFVNKKSDIIFNNFKKYLFPFLKKGRIIIYNSFKKEVKTDKIIAFLKKKKYEIFNPCLINEKIVPCKFFTKKISGPFQIKEPAKKIKLKSFNNISAIIIPGIAFDRNGNRLGFGKGYFDKFLSKIKKRVLKIGLAYSFQILKRIPSTKNDIKMDIIISDREIIHVDKKKKNL